MSADPTPLLVERARRAQPDIAATLLDERLELARRSAATLRSIGEELVAVSVAETRRPVKFVRRELETALQFVEALPALADSVRPRDVPAASGSTRLEFWPYGVVLGWHAANAPIWVPTLVALSALVGGNALLARPSQRTRATSRLTIEALAEPWPTDAIVIADLDWEEAERLIVAPGIDAVVAHSSTEICKRHLGLLGRAYEEGARLRPYIPEASGNDALLVLGGADLDRAAEAIAVGGFANSGQLCMSAKRIVVERAVWDELSPRLERAVQSLVIGPPEDPQTDVVPLGPGRARDLSEAHLVEALERGGSVVAGSADGCGELPVIVQIPADATDIGLWREESFGPVRSLVLAEDAGHAVALSNDSVFGLGGAVFGGTPAVADRLRGARIVVEEGPLYQDPHLIVGGVADSGLAGAKPKLEQLVWARRIHRAQPRLE